MDSTRVTYNETDGTYTLHVPGKSDFILSQDELLALYDEIDPIVAQLSGETDEKKAV